MGRILIAAAVASLVAGLGAAAQQPVFRGGGDVVRVFSTVTDNDGRLVTTLGRDDFEVRDEGKPQPITQFDNTPQPIRLIVLLDVSGSMEGNLSLLRAGADELFTRLRPDDLVRVGTFGASVDLGPPVHRRPARDAGGAAASHLARRADAVVARRGRSAHGVRHRSVRCGRSSSC